MFGSKTRHIARLQAALDDTAERLLHTRREAESARQTLTFAIRKRGDAEAGAKRVADQNTVLRERLEALLKDSGLNAFDAEYEHLDQRHHRAKLRIVRYVVELRQLRGTVADQAAGLRAQGKRIAVLEKQLDDALGLDDPDIEAGKHWQSRRPDKPHPFRRASSSPSAPLPTREPGIAEASRA